MPCHRFLAKVEADGMPRNAVVVTLIFAGLLSLIIIGSAAAFNVIISLGVGSGYACYIIIISTIVYRRFDGNDFPPTK